MKYPTVVFDVDGVLANFTKSFTTLRYALYGVGPVLDKDEAATWDSCSRGASVENSKTWDHIMQSPTFWQDMEPAFRVEEGHGLPGLVITSNLYFVTARAGLHVKRQTEWWLHKHLGIAYPTVVLTKYKGDFCKTVGANYCIDDKADNASAVAWITHGKTKSYLLDRPYNRYDETKIGSSKVIRAHSIAEYISDIYKEML